MDESILVYFLIDTGSEREWIESIEQFVDDLAADDFYHKRTDIDPETKVRLVRDGFSVSARAAPADRHPFEIDGPLLRLSRNIDEIYGTETLGAFREVVRIVYEATSPRYAFGMLSYQVDALGVEHPQPISEAIETDRRVEHPTWLMAFSPALVESHGEDWLRNLPVEDVEELPDGGLLLLTTSNLTDGTDVYESRRTLESVWE